MFHIYKMSPLTVRINLPQIFKIYAIRAFRKLLEDFQEKILGGVTI